MSGDREVKIGSIVGHFPRPYCVVEAVNLRTSRDNIR
jgi:hypothetical protein